ncbi:LacI family DNA-binding transcriptional regulator [Flavobacterium sp. SM2513]|uniref:LacI family DNA-binding transcriptional regulator n=1 Tax=Flavobacterium sp. SM2513 TaxID=3424766 RepID=UPI003D7FC08C
MKRITLKDLSKHLNLSTSTISRALLDEKNINATTKQRVLEAAQDLGYKPNATALNLKTGKTKSIGFVVPEMVTPFSAKVLKGVQKVLYPLGYKVIILQSDEKPANERENLLLLERFNVDGIIINLCHETQNQNLYKEIIERGTPMVFFDRIPPATLEVSKVVVNDSIKAALMVEHLLSVGCKKIVHLMGPSSVRNASERANGYKRILTKHHILEPQLIVPCEGVSLQDGKKAVEKLLERGIEFDGIFAFTDTLAIGAMNYLLQHGKQIPEDVAIASFSGTELSNYVFPPLTSVEQPLVKMGKAAGKLVLEHMQNLNAPARTILLDAKLIYRSSTKGKAV